MADTLTLSQGQNITLWPDQSGNGNDASVQGGDVAPTFNTNQINALPTASFTGTQRMYVPTLAPVGTLSIFAVVKVTSSTGDQHYVSCFWTLATSGGGIGNYNGNYHIFVCSGGTLAANNFTTPITAANHYIDMQVDGSAAIGTVDAVQIYNTVCGPMSNAAGQTLFIGASHYGAFATVEIAEILYYNPVLSSGDQTTVRSYLAAKYAL